MRYPGGKAKVYQHIINLLPKHEVYIEPFLGGGSVLRSKAISPKEIGVDMDAAVLNDSVLVERGVSLINGDGISFLESYEFDGTEVVYCDPPYLPDSRKKTNIYKYEATHDDHVRLLQLITKLDTNIIISGYKSELYFDYLNGWNVYEYTAKAHDGIRKEYLWYNYPTPKALHDYRYMGGNYRERQTVKRRIERLQRRISELSMQEQAFILEWMQREVNTDAA